MTAKIEKMETGISGFDDISNGGLPKGRTTLVVGTPGSTKSVFSGQFLVEGVKKGQAGVFVTFEEQPEDIRLNLAGLGWDVAAYEAANLWRFVDVSPNLEAPETLVGKYDLSALIARIEAAIQEVGAQRIAIDAVGTLFDRFPNLPLIRHEMLRMLARLRTFGVTGVMTAERDEEYGALSRNGIEAFAADNVMILRNISEDETRRRTVEILKFRGTTHQKGEFPYTVVTNEGIIVLPLSGLTLTQQSSNVRATTGIAELDVMTGGGYFQDSVILASGPTGTGKTLLTTEFLDGGAKSGQKCLLLGFEESREQLFRNATGWGRDFEHLEKTGVLKVVCAYPEAASLEEHHVTIKREILAYQPDRIVIDSLTALERITTIKGFREFVVALTAFVKTQRVLSLFTTTSSTLLGGDSVTQGNISTITDAIVLLRYVELYGEMQRGIAVLKMRGSMHDKEIRSYEITEKGMQIGKPFRNVVGILSGAPTYVQREEQDRTTNLFR